MIIAYIALTVYLLGAMACYAFLSHVASDDSGNHGIDATELFAIDPRAGMLPGWFLLLAVAVTWPIWIWSVSFDKEDGIE